MYVSGRGGVNLHGKPTTDSSVEVFVPNGSKVSVISGPIKGNDGRQWYKVIYGSKTGYIYVPLLTAQAGRSITLPVLEYHGFLSNADQYDVPIPTFAKQLDWLKANGYTTVTLTQVYDYMLKNGKLPSKPVLITMDDGRATQWQAVQELKKRDMTAVLFVQGGGVMLNWDQLRQISKWGFEIESHTMTHPINPELPGLSDKQLHYEVFDSKQVLEAKLGIKVRFLAYPGGSYDDRVIRVLKAAGYQGGITAWGGGYWSPGKRWYEPRTLVDGRWDLSQFEQTIKSLTETS